MKKRIFILLMTAIIALSIAGCSAQNNKPAEADAQAVTDAAQSSKDAAQSQTESLSGADDPGAAYTEEPETLPEGAFYYTDRDNIWQITVPAVWNDLGKIVESESASTRYVRFVYSKAYEAEGSGHVFTIATCTDPSDFLDVSQLPKGHELYRSDKTQVYVYFPSDVQFIVGGNPTEEEIETLRIEYESLSKTWDSIFESFKWYEQG